MTWRERVAALRLNSDDLRLFITCFAGGVLLAVMTGPEGDLTDPLYSIGHALFSSHVWGFLIFGVALGVASIYRRKLRAGVLTRSREVPRRSIRKTIVAYVAGTGLAAKVVTAVVALLAALLIADYTGPLVPHKLSFHQIVHQFAHTRTYGYILVIFWLLNAMRVNARPRNDTVRGPGFLRSAWAKILGGAIGGLFFALCADPWLPLGFHFSFLTFSGNSDRAFFHHWTTYLWTFAGLIVGLRAANLERHAAQVATTRRRPARKITVSTNTRLALYAGAMFVAVEAPKFLNPFWQETIFQQIGIFCLLAIGLNVVVGFAGLLDLGYVAFYALGAYTNAYFTGALPIHPPFVLNAFLSIPFAIIVAMLAGVLLGLPTLRLRGDYLAIVTLGFGEIIYVLASNLTNITDGAGGTGPTGKLRHPSRGGQLRAQRPSPGRRPQLLLPAAGLHRAHHLPVQLTQPLQSWPVLGGHPRRRGGRVVTRHQQPQVQGDGLRYRRVDVGGGRRAAARPNWARSSRRTSRCSSPSPC